MNDDSGKIVPLLTGIRDNQQEAIALQKTAVLRQKRATRVYYVAVALPVSVYYTYLTFHH